MDAAAAKAADAAEAADIAEAEAAEADGYGYGYIRFGTLIEGLAPGICGTLMIDNGLINELVAFKGRCGSG